MKKIGIMSMQRVCNYGSFLQAYALKKLIEQLGHSVEFVDYHVGECVVKIESNNKKFYKVKKALEYLKFNAPLESKLKFIRLKKNYGKNNYDLLGINKEYNYNPHLDVLVIGSDEVFNCIQDNPNVGYSMELFGKNNNAKKLISYAASFGNTTSDKLKKYNVDGEIKELLSNFDMISVRDNNSFNIVAKLTDKNVCINLDPVLIYDYMNICSEIPNNVKEKNYIILYGYPGRFSQGECNVIKEYARKNNKKIFCIGGFQSVCDKLIDCSPFEVLAYFKNADAIITDTFHGTIFSIITKKNFVTLIRKSHGREYGNEEKLTDLLERLKLSNRIIKDMKNIENYFGKDIDYTEAYEVLNSERIKAKEYLKSNL